MPVFSLSFQMVIILKLWTDITDLKEKEKQALDAEKRLQDAIDSMPHGISLWDKNDILVMCNKYAHNIHFKAGIKDYRSGLLSKIRWKDTKNLIS